MAAKKTKPKKEKDGTLADAIKDIKKRFGSDSIMTLNEKPNVDVDAVPTGSIGLNHALGIGGFPRGRIVEVYGSENKKSSSVRPS